MPGFNAVLPQIITEVALNPGQPVSGAGTMTLDSTSFGLLDTDWLAGADSWTDISAYVRAFSITRASSRVQGPLLAFQAGTASITLLNDDGRFDPDNLSGPYVSGGVSQVHAMVPVRIRAVFNGMNYPLFAGFADSWQEPSITFASNESEWTLSATDGFKALYGITLPALGSPVGAGELSGARINRILNAAGWYTGQGAGARFVDTGNSPLQATSFNDTALNLLQLAADSEIGMIYIDASGAFQFRERQALITDSRSNTSQATFGDDPASPPATELACSTIARADDDTTIGNDIQATINGSSNMQEVMNSASIALYLFPRTYARTDLILQADADALNWAGWMCYISSYGEDRFESISVDPAADSVNLWQQVLGRDIGDRITGIRRPPGVSPAITKQGFISGVTHSFDSGTSQWLTTWTLQDASKYSDFLILDNAVFGQLDHNALVF